MVIMILQEILTIVRITCHYMSLVEIKDFRTLTDSKPFFDQPKKKKCIKSLLQCQGMMTIQQETC